MWCWRGRNESIIWRFLFYFLSISRQLRNSSNWILRRIDFVYLSLYFYMFSSFFFFSLFLYLFFILFSTLCVSRKTSLLLILRNFITKYVSQLAYSVTHQHMNTNRASGLILWPWSQKGPKVTLNAMRIPLQSLFQTLPLSCILKASKAERQTDS